MFIFAQRDSCDPAAFPSLFGRFRGIEAFFNQLEKFWCEAVGVELIINGPTCSKTELCLRSNTRRVCVWIRVDFLSVYVTNKETKTGFNYVICYGVYSSFNCYGRKKFKEGDFSYKPFPIRQSWKFSSSPPLLIYYERRKGAKWKFDKTNKGLPKQRLLLSFLSFVLNEYRLSIGIAGKKICPLVKFPS